MSTKPVLLVLAAGMGSRYGGLKQMDKVGPSGETIIDYSIYDALRAGFRKVVFIIRKDIEADFRELYHEKLSKHIEIEYVHQELNKLPEGFSVPEGRQKPWGTSHAVQVASNAINGPFAVINADDFYGADAYKVLYNYLDNLPSENEFCMVGYQLDRTLSEHGYVSRGVCQTDADGYLTTVTERTQIERIDGKITFPDEKGHPQTLSGNETVSMNMWGFSALYFTYANEMFRAFLSKNADNLKSEFYIPTVVNELIQKDIIKLKVLKSSASWFGVTYKEDREAVASRIRDLVSSNQYPENLWNV